MKIPMKIEGAIHSRVSILNPSFLLQTHKMRRHFIFRNAILFNAVPSLSMKTTSNMFLQINFINGCFFMVLFLDYANVGEEALRCLIPFFKWFYTRSKIMLAISSSAYNP